MFQLAVSLQSLSPPSPLIYTLPHHLAFLQLIIILALSMLGFFGSTSVFFLWGCQLDPILQGGRAGHMRPNA